MQKSPTRLRIVAAGMRECGVCVAVIALGFEAFSTGLDDRARRPPGRELPVGGTECAYVIAAPDVIAAATTDLAKIGSTIKAATADAALPTTGVASAAADEVSAAVAVLFGSHAQGYQALTAQAAAFHDQVRAAKRWRRAVRTGRSHCRCGCRNPVNAPTQALTGRPLIGNGANGVSGGTLAQANGGAGGFCSATAGPGRPTRLAKAERADLPGWSATAGAGGAAGERRRRRSRRWRRAAAGQRRHGR